MFMGKTTNNSLGVNVNSTFYVSYSDTCMLKLGGWNQSLSIKFHPVKGTTSEGLRQYATDRTEIVTTSLTVDNATALIKGINDVITPAINDKKEGSVSVVMGDAANRKVLTVKTDGNDVFCTVAIGVSESGTTTPENILSHKFNKKSYMVDYDAGTGSYDEVPTHADFINFVEKLNDVYKLTSAIAHSINYSNAVKSSYSNKSTYNNNNNSGNNTGYSAQTNNIGSFDEFEMPFA